MGSAKRQQEQKSNKIRLNPYEKQLRRYEALRTHFAEQLSNLVGAIEDDFRPLLSLKLVRRDDGGFLLIMTRDDDLKEQVIFGYGADVWDALLKTNAKLAASDWKESKPWNGGS